MDKIAELKGKIALEKDPTILASLQAELIIEEQKVADELEAMRLKKEEADRVAEEERQKIKDEAIAVARAEFEKEKQEEIDRIKAENEKAVKELKDKYLSDDIKKQLIEEERIARENQELLDRTAKEEADKLKWEQEKALILERGRKADITEVAEEFKVPTHLKKYIDGKTIEEMRISAKSIVSDMIAEEKVFNDRVQAEVEKRLLGSKPFVKGGGDTGVLTLKEFRDLDIYAKSDLLVNDPETFHKLKAELDSEREY